MRCLTDDDEDPLTQDAFIDDDDDSLPILPTTDDVDDRIEF